MNWVLWPHWPLLSSVTYKLWGNGSNRKQTIKLNANMMGDCVVRMATTFFPICVFKEDEGVGRGASVLGISEACDII